MRGRILFIDHKTPAPDEDSGSECAFSYLKILSRAGFDVTFAPFGLTPAGRHTQALNDLGVKNTGNAGIDVDKGRDRSACSTLRYPSALSCANRDTNI